MKNNFKTFPDSRKFEPDTDDGEFGDGAYIVAISTWFLDFKKELKEQLRKIEETEKDPAYWQMSSSGQIMENETRKRFIRELLGVDEDSSKKEGQ